MTAAGAEDTARPYAAPAWQARILDPTGTPLAVAAVLVAERTLLTCAAVLDRAPAGVVLAEFHGDGRTWGVPARLAPTGPRHSLAVLHLERAPDAVPAPLGRCGGRIGFTVSVYGHAGTGAGPAPRVRARVAGGSREGLRRLEPLEGTWETGRFVGAGVWDTERGRVVGVVAPAPAAPADTAGAVRMIPFDVLDATRFGELLSGNFPPGHNAAQQATTQGELWPLVESLLAIESVASDGGAAVLSLLPGRIAWGVPRQSRPRLQLLHLVRRCGEFEEGPAALVAAVRVMEGDTSAVQRFIRLAGQTWPHRLRDDA
ncbi:trypsin-like peptidase domain-containing protein [Streptomyces sp. NPDC052012]|uniref:effector-associated domain 2-containing protein n=1 Tax=Streptomyces sp. NPDC052012 TaxID=3155051 RepID=UPI00344C6F71